MDNNNNSMTNCISESGLRQAIATYIETRRVGPTKPPEPNKQADEGPQAGLDEIQQKIAQHLASRSSRYEQEEGGGGRNRTICVAGPGRDN
jgi:hypothetical protein